MFLKFSQDDSPKQISLVARDSKVFSQQVQATFATLAFLTFNGIEDKQETPESAGVREPVDWECSTGSGGAFFFWYLTLPYITRCNYSRFLGWGLASVVVVGFGGQSGSTLSSWARCIYRALGVMSREQHNQEKHLAECRSMPS